MAENDDAPGKGGGRHAAEHGEKDGKASSGGDEKAGSRSEAEPRSRWPLLVALAVAILFTGGVLLYVFLPHRVVYTNDAYVTAHYATIAPRISGQVSAVLVDDNQRVTAGQLLAMIDDRDYRAALSTAEAQLERDRAQVEDVTGTIARQPAVIDQSKAQVDSTAAQLSFARANQRRYRNLASTGAGTEQDRQQADTAVQQAEATIASNRASEEAARRQVPIQEAQRRAAMATVKADEARVEQARLDLSYTRIVAPIDGMVARRSVQVGNIVAPGAAMMAVVPLDDVYVEANYREVELRHMLPGQPARIHVDAYDIDIDGVVDSISPASGAAFSPIQPNNATGNFTKIVQRLPVKIVVSPGQDLAKLLRIGFSVETYVDTGLADVSTRQQGNPQRVTGER
ncbi:HlyD family secretion protein [Roseomonas elaeocarpi]|uniref:HlyD family secretion protein n=1 Tax=Roseomonas elaeocarpi TaxID=907779 RepID=A0ABV6JNE0_9PROT